MYIERENLLMIPLKKYYEKNMFLIVFLLLSFMLQFEQFLAMFSKVHSIGAFKVCRKIIFVANLFSISKVFKVRMKKLN